MWGETTPATDRDCSWSTYKYTNGAENNLTKYVPESKTSHYGDNGFLTIKQSSTLRMTLPMSLSVASSVCQPTLSGRNFMKTVLVLGLGLGSMASMAI